MAIADIVHRVPSKVSKGPTCSTCAALADLPEQEAAALLALLSMPRLPYTIISDELRAEGIDISYGALSRHARGVCEARTKLR